MIDLLGPGSLDLLQSADRLAKFILEGVSASTSVNPHKKAIMLTFLTHQMLEATYEGNEDLLAILKEAHVMLEAFTKMDAQA